MAYTLPTNYTQNITGMQVFAEYVNHVSDGWFFTAILFAIWFIVFIAFKAYSSSRAFAGTSFFAMVLAIMLRALGLISNTWMYLTILLTAFSVVWLYKTHATGV